MKIETSLDWPKVQQELNKLGNLLPSFKHDIKRVCDTLKQEITILSQLEVENRRIHNPGTQRRCQEQAEKINEILKTISKYHLMAVLAQ